jgi:hypothetical protein
MEAGARRAPAVEDAAEGRATDDRVSDRDRAGMRMPDRARALWRRHRGEAPVLAALAVALACHRVIPAVAWIVPALVVAGFIGWRLLRLDRRAQAWILACTGASLALQGVVLAVFGYHDPVSSDPRDYMLKATAVMEAWRSGVYPALSLKGSLPHLGSLHTGYERVLASLFLVWGPRPWVGIGLNVACVAALPALAFLACLSLFGEFGAKSPDPRDGRRARVACLLAGLYPGFVFWMTWLVKDTLLVAAFAASLVLLLEALRTRSLVAWSGFVLASGFLVILRAYAGLSVYAALAVYAFARMPRRAVLWGAGYALLTVALVGYSMSGTRLFGQLWSSLLALIPGGMRTVPESLGAFVLGLPRCFLGPYGWVKAQGDNLYYGLYPGMWFLYLAVYPLALAGLWEAVRRNHLATTVPLVIVFTAVMIFLMTYGGEAQRQRLYLEFVYLLYAGAGACAPAKRRWFAACYGALFLFAAVQLISLSLRS